jgi:chromosome segregation ATPase
MRNVAIALAASAVLACAGSQKKPVTVSDADYGRLTPGQTGPVEQVRVEQGNARDAAARAKLRQTESRHEVELAQADEKAAEADRLVAESAAKSAKESNDPAQLESARNTSETAQLRKRAADAHLDYAKKLQALRDAELEAANERVAYQNARLERAKLTALQTSQVPAATKYDAAQLDASVSQAQAAMQQADSKVHTANAEVGNAGRTWQELDRQLQARGGTPKTRG